MLKVCTIRSPWVLMLIAQLVIILGVSGRVKGADDLADPKVAVGAVAHVGLAALFALIAGIMAVAGEHRHRTITDAYLSEPRRARVVAAKLTVHTGLGALFGLIGAATALLSTAIWYAAEGSTLDSVPWRTVVGAVIWNMLFAAIGVGAGALVRNLIAAVAGALAWLALVEGLVGQLIPDAARWLPITAGTALEQLPTLKDPPGAVAAGAVLVAYAALFSVAAVLTTTRRDVT